ncbi:FAM172 family protein [Histomonas meleagridis]|uniref:FAM172 family protein n=1 Tax=Histomonas meleagridis TaxID=135588 RepID=UPI00355AC2A0|nr:FAM172 family protein [Histomonas meleagridis]KAH0797452.1 FAM172 family protein [Histomonas meleagridis]
MKQVSESWKDPGTGKTLHFNEEGMFVDDEGKGPQKGFKNDNHFCDWIHDYVHNKMLEMGLVMEMFHEVPIYRTKDALNSPQKLLVLICGAGRIMAGLWSVGVCAYHGLAAGSVLEALKEGQKRGMEAIILNPNYARSRFNHCNKVFEELIIPGNPENVYIICHSMGGASTTDIISQNPEWCIDHVRAIAMTDGCEGYAKASGFKVNKWCHEIGINWIRSDKEINQELGSGPSTMHRSAATNDHPLTTWKAFPYIWELFDQKEAAGPVNKDDFVGKEEVKSDWW